MRRCQGAAPFQTEPQDASLEIGQLFVYPLGIWTGFGEGLTADWRGSTQI